MPSFESERASLYGKPGDDRMLFVRNGRSASEQQPDVAALLTQLIEGQVAISKRLDAIEAAQGDRIAEVRTYVLGLHDRLYDLHDAIEDHDNATRPDAVIISLIPNTDNEEN